MNDNNSSQPEIREPGRGPDGRPIFSERRLYMQLLVYTGLTDEPALLDEARKEELPAVIYRSLLDPTGVGLLSFSEDPAFFAHRLRDFVQACPLRQARFRPDMTMFGRSYSLGYEAELDHVLVDRPRKRVLNPDWPWAVWYPLRRSGAFAKLPPEEQKEILGEHGRIGMAFGAADFAHDIRLACHGLDTHDNDFLVGLVGPRLQPLSAVVQTMRSTRQTSEFLVSLGPFFVGHAIYQAAIPT